jgi:hypothetical protein
MDKDKTSTIHYKNLLDQERQGRKKTGPPEEDRRATKEDDKFLSHFHHLYTSSSPRNGLPYKTMSSSSDKLLPTSVVGSYPQPGWLIDQEKLRGSLCSRVRRKELWRVAEDQLESAQVKLCRGTDL